MKEYYFDSVDKRNDFITECCFKNLKYNYYNVNSEGKYKVVVFEEDK